MSLATWSKKQLPKNWSYPVGLEILNNFLGDIPNSLEKSIQFCDGTSYWSRNPHSKFQEEPYIELAHAHFALFNPNQIGWTIRINSVPSNQRSIIAERLSKEGLPRIRKWLHNQNVSETNIITQPFCAFVFQNTRDGFRWIWKDSSNGIQKVEEIPIEPEEQIQS
jgi:hypothetical protein